MHHAPPSTTAAHGHDLPRQRRSAPARFLGLVCIMCWFSVSPGCGSEPAAAAADSEPGRSTPTDAPKLSLAPTALRFDQVTPGSVATQHFVVTNSGAAVLEIDTIEFTATGPLTLIGPAGASYTPGEPIVLNPPITLSPQRSAQFWIRFSPTDPHKKLGAVRFRSNDPTPAAGELSIVANATSPCMQLEPAGPLNLAGVQKGTAKRLEMRIKSCGGTALVVDAVEFVYASKGAQFSLDFTKLHAKYPGVDASIGPTKAKPLKIAINAEAVFEVIYAPQDVSAHDPSTGEPVADTAQLRLTTNATTSKNSIICEGFGVDQACPNAKVSVSQGQEVVPQTSLALQGEESHAADGGPIEAYKWTAKQPGGGKEVFKPSDSVANPTFVVSAAGEYEFCLEVWDQAGQKSCAPACLTLLVLPEEAVHVELLWKTPADPDETDSGPAAGADLDLHFAHDLAAESDIDCDGVKDPWFSKSFDTFWFNPNPSWGSVNPSVSDDPSLDLDDADGAGPENLNLDEPEGTVGAPSAYHIGVHYWNAHGFGTSFATVHIYVLGVLALQIEGVAMEELDMWYVGKLNWPNSMSAPGLTIDPFRICYRSGDPCDAANPGKYWVPKGSWCVHSCYDPPASVSGAGSGGAACKKP